MEQVKVKLEPTEYSGLVRLCERELRSVPEQVRHLVREELRRQSLLNAEQPPSERRQPGAAHV